MLVINTKVLAFALSSLTNCSLTETKEGMASITDLIVDWFIFTGLAYPALDYLFFFNFGI
ncbi:MAG: hypothetical protein PHX16_03510 [Syntrophaceticus sp.]|jgi:hypothetical protein|nr:hypothetical protein [Syntrophaceticus sp.]MDD4360164.1 hypothetical protein [Syntrophaceticus sp.]MDD4782700.1 hypothetical protein [Syntrophaceticus sp.]